jgi:hypothetical protein
MEILKRKKATYASNNDFEIILHSTESPNDEARFAMQMIERHGMVTAQDGGEDSKGRAMLDIMQEEDVVDRAFMLAKLTFEAAKKRGLMVHVGTEKEILEELYQND